MISGLSMIGYVATRWLGPGRGTVITGLTGGLVSSTAATLAFSRQSKESDSAQAAQMLAVGTLIAWAVMFFRVMVISFAVYPALLRDLAGADDGDGRWRASRAPAFCCGAGAPTPRAASRERSRSARPSR